MGALLAILGALGAMATPPPRPPLPPGVEGELVVSLTVLPVVAEPTSPPRLTVTITNASDKSLKVSPNASAACFAAAYLDLDVLDPQGKPLPKAKCDSSERSTEVDLAPAASQQRVLALQELFPAAPWSPGLYKIEVVWRPSMPPVRLKTLNVESFRLAKVLAQVRVEKGKSVSLPDGAQLTFTAHSHKRTRSDGPPSPLIVYGTFAAPGSKAPAEFQRNLFPSESRTFEIDGCLFELADHQYDAWMQLKYFGKP